MYEMLVEKLRLNCAARELWLPLVPQYAEQINLFKEAAYDNKPVWQVALSGNAVATESRAA